MKIVVLGTRGFPGVQGGVEAHCENLYTRLVKQGCEVTVFTRLPYIDPTIKEYNGVKLIPISCPKSKSLEAIVHTFKGVLAAKKLKPDVLHIHAIGPSLFVPLARILGLKVVMTHHGPDYMRKKWGGLAKLVLRLGEWAGVTFANQVIAISRTIADEIKVKYGREAIVIPNGVVVPELKEKWDSPIQQGKLSVGTVPIFPGKYVLAVGRFVPEKGFCDLIEAFEKMGTPFSASAQDWKLVIAGDADHEDKYSLELKEKARANLNILLTGFISGEPLKELYSHAGLFVLPSYYEGLPIVLLEAMSYGLSCIVSDIPANKEVGLPENRYFAPGDVNAMVEKIREFVDKPLGPDEIARQISVLREKYDWDRIAERTMGVYREI